ncbi:ABC transporter ATP-binding protein [Halobellus rufus]|uniref:ABC transporter ATP-binding protein n=1 Tax=Halobellus rufus TaxID=1448860 RepID=UPI0006789B1E|nr:ABC transporter ATP-binding protein [Halobellus rufus]
MTLTLSGLAKARGEFALGPLDLSIADEVFCVLGPSGSGKSTLLSLLAGISEPDDGTVAVDGRSMNGRPPEERRVGLVFQDGALFPHLTARENVEYAAEDPEYVGELTEILSIDDVLDRRPASLSGGERQRVALARTLASEPDVLLLDEPLSSLDEPISRRLRGDLDRLFDTLAVPVIYVTHDQRTATALADRIAILNDGRIEQVDAPTTVLERPASRFVAEFTGNENVFEVRFDDRNGRGPRIGGTLLRGPNDRSEPAAGLEATPGVSAVTVCVHPSRIRFPADSDFEDAAYRVPVTIERWLHENDSYRVFARVNESLDLTATMSRIAFDRLDPARGDETVVAIPTDSIHVLEQSDSR